VNIIVFVKQVLDTEARIFIKGDGKSLEVENKYALNYFDEFAVEEALRLKEKIEDCQITVCSYGPKRAIEVLRTAIAMGADRACLLDGGDLEASDSLVTAKILAGFARKEDFDLVLCGRQAMDDENAIIGPMVAELLGIPHVSAITRLEVSDESTVVVEAEIEGGKVTLEVRLPVLLTAQKGLNEPRVPLITGVMKAMKTGIPTVDLASLGISREEMDRSLSKATVLLYETPPSRPPVRMVEGDTPDEKVRNLVAILQEEAKAI
jgi:electron transfer flavoprotein beta subunit